MIRSLSYCPLGASAYGHRLTDVPVRFRLEGCGHAVSVNVDPLTKHPKHQRERLSLQRTLGVQGLTRGNNQAGQNSHPPRVTRIELTKPKIRRKTWIPVPTSPEIVAGLFFFFPFFRALRQLNREGDEMLKSGLLETLAMGKEGIGVVKNESQKGKGGERSPTLRIPSAFRNLQHAYPFSIPATICFDNHALLRAQLFSVNQNHIDCRRQALSAQLNRHPQQPDRPMFFLVTCMTWDDPIWCTSSFRWVRHPDVAPIHRGLLSSINHCSIAII
ncbi:hypothetical protein QR685DRAFT_94276 [Neurospora intermedia]|uniref:Uncharacterized protein n=1 Tax=Neurospora intermedia TaxID=5142 RepID=A0ABR3D2Q3_NEUIN